MDFAASHVKQLDKGRLNCGLCPHNCVVDPGRFGDCCTRYNKDGTMVVIPYGRLQAVALDPVEKKPLFHFRPGSSTFSVASAGCNLVCPFCQNHSLSQALRSNEPTEPVARQWTPAELIDAAVSYNSASISFTYSEPILQFEFARDTAELARSKGIEIIFVTNGQVNEAPAGEIAGFINAANVDLKCFSASAYKNVLGGSLKATTRAIEILHSARVWVEVTTLLIPKFNDSDEEIRSIADFIAQLDVNIPWHVSRFHPDFRWTDRGATPMAALSRARQIGIAQGLKYVYTGNIPGDEGENTICPSCGKVIVERLGYRVGSIKTAKGKCAACGELIAGVGLP